MQEYHVETLALCSGLRWTEASKVSAGFLKRTVQQRQQRTHIAQHKHPDTGVICTSSNDMLDAAASFYSTLYTPDPVDEDFIQQMLDDLPPSLQLSEAAYNSITKTHHF